MNLAALFWGFGEALEKAIRQVSNEVANLFVGGFGEPKF